MHQMRQESLITLNTRSREHVELAEALPVHTIHWDLELLPICQIAFQRVRRLQVATQSAMGHVAILRQRARHIHVSRSGNAGKSPRRKRVVRVRVGNGSARTSPKVSTNVILQSQLAHLSVAVEVAFSVSGSHAYDESGKKNQRRFLWA